VGLFAWSRWLPRAAHGLATCTAARVAFKSVYKSLALGAAARPLGPRETVGSTVKVPHGCLVQRFLEAPGLCDAPGAQKRSP